MSKSSQPYKVVASHQWDSENEILTPIKYQLLIKCEILQRCDLYCQPKEDPWLPNIWETCWDRWDSAHPWAHLQACHMPGSVLSLVSPRDDFISLQYNWRNRSRNWQLLGYANYYARGKLQILGAHRDIVGTQIGPSGVREGFLELSEATQWERYGNSVVRGNSICKGTEVLVLLQWGLDLWVSQLMSFLRCQLSLGRYFALSW